LILIGLTIFLGTASSRLFKRFKIPQVIAFIIIGFLLGDSVFGIIKREMLSTFSPFNIFVLGITGFLIGGELKSEIFKKYGKQFVNILLSEGLFAFVLVTVFVVFLGNLFFENSAFIWALGLLLGSIAAATAPAATTDVLWEYKARGPLTTTILGIVGLDDGLGLVLFAIASSVALAIVGVGETGGAYILVEIVYGIGVSIVIGIFGGVLMSLIVKKLSDKYAIVTFSIGIIAVVLGFSKALDCDILLSAMAAGVFVTNFIPRKSKEIFELTNEFMPALYILFFTFFGAQLNLDNLTLPIILIAIVYIIGRTLGKGLGANFGARISKAPRTVQKYLPWCLFSQAGVAIGLSILASERFPGEIGNSIVVIVTATTFVVQIIGPLAMRVAVTKAGEAGLNISEEDIVRMSKAQDIMDTAIPLIYEGVSLIKIIKIFSETDNLYYPVLDKKKKLLGVITVDNIKNSFKTSGLDAFLLAHDLMEPVIAKVSPDVPMTEVNEILSRYNLEYLPVVSSKNEVLGFLERRNISRKIFTKLIELQKKAEMLE
ncbi:cation:proton antiporter, partial [candidate division WOR-3 bacterium]|nr:cation:proton antiporter [candidate division WOR-3 bacterium]